MHHRHTEPQAEDGCQCFTVTAAAIMAARVAHNQSRRVRLLSSCCYVIPAHAQAGRHGDGPGCSCCYRNCSSSPHPTRCRSWAVADSDPNCSHCGTADARAVKVSIRLTRSRTARLDAHSLGKSARPMSLRTGYTCMSVLRLSWRLGYLFQRLSAVRLSVSCPFFCSNSEESELPAHLGSHEHDDCNVLILVFISS